MWPALYGALLLLITTRSDAQLQNSQETTETYYRPFNRYDDRDQVSVAQWDKENSREGGYRYGLSPFGSTSDVVLKTAKYFVLASRMVRPGQIYRVAAHVMDSPIPMVVRATIQMNGVEIAADYKEVREGIPEMLMLKMPPTSVRGHYHLRVEGSYNTLTGGQAFLNETSLTFSQRSMTIFIQCDKPVYMQGQTIRFRAIPINTELKAFDDTVEVYMLDPNKRIMRRWLSRQSNLGTVSLSYQLSDQPVFGEWTIRVTAQGQIEEKAILVEEYYQTRFEVNVTMPAFFFDTDEYVHGTIHANYTSGGPVKGNLTLKASLRNLDRYANQEVQEKYLFLDEEYPSWYRPAPNRLSYLPPVYYISNSMRQSGSDRYEYDRYERAVVDEVPVLRFFNGSYHFKYPLMGILAGMQSTGVEGYELTITATVGEHFLEEIIQGYSMARIYNSTIKINFFGDSPQVFKPNMPFDLNLIAAYHDGSPLRPEQLINATMTVRGEFESRSGGRKIMDTKVLRPSPESPAIWSLKVNLRNELRADSSRVNEQLSDIYQGKFYADFVDSEGHRAYTELLMLAHESPGHHNIKVWTSTQKPKVGEYLVLHCQSNFHMETFNYVIMSKGIIILGGEEKMKPDVTTFTISLSPEMAPVSTVVVYDIDRRGEVVADSLTFPVNGISRNNFTVFINNQKARTGGNVEVAIYGEPGAYVGLSGIDHSFYTMQAGNELTYYNVIAKMSHYDEETNGTHNRAWLFHSGDPDKIVSFPSPTLGIDVNRTFEYIGLVVFTDGYIYRKPDVCNRTQGYLECLNGRCYRIENQCDGVIHCDDGTDEARCPHGNATELTNFRKLRFNRIQRQYENVWLWKDINIGPHGRYIFNIDVPRTPVHWMITAFGMSPTDGFGMLSSPIEYTAIFPFYINVEMPTHSKQGEQIGIRVTVFNYQRHNIEATVVLPGSPDYKFVHVEEHGIVASYSPRTSFGEHQFFLWIPKQDATVVYIPIVPVRLGEILVTINATTLVGKDSITRTLLVEADGLPQYRHQAILLDLSNRAYVFQYMHVNITETPIITDDENRYYIFGSNKATISVVGDVVGPIFPTMPVNATSLIGLPMDCAEQNMFSFAAHMYTTLHMRFINQRNRSQEKESFYYMNIGYQRQMSFMNPDGSFSLFRSDWNQSSPSVWLTAYCVRIFEEASFYEWENFLYIDPKVISQAVSWVLQHQTPEGSFYEVTWLPDRKMNSTLHFDEEMNYNNRHRNISLTAHVLITLETVKDLSDGIGSKVALAAANAIRYLEHNLKLLELRGDPFEIAIVAYALLQAKASHAEQAFNILRQHRREEGGLIYWGRDMVPQPPTKNENQRPFSLPRLPYKFDAENIQTTAYALLVHVARQEVNLEPIVKWLNSQRLTDSGWASTQDTAWAMKALMEYTGRSRIRDVSQLSVKVEATALQGKPQELFVNNKNLARLQSIEIPEAWGTVKVTAKGAGYAILQMSVQYNVDNKKFQTHPPVQAFDLSTRAQFYGRNQSHISYVSCQRWTYTDESPRSGMAVLDITIPTGYIIQQQVLDYYVRSRQTRNLQRARFQHQKVLFYFDYLDEEETCVNLTIERWYPVANMSRYLPIRVYDYYAPERFNETIFDAISTYILNICEVCGSSQCPYCPIYNAAFILTSSGYLIATLSVLVTIVAYFRTQEFRIY